MRSVPQIRISLIRAHAKRVPPWTETGTQLKLQVRPDLWEQDSLVDDGPHPSLDPTILLRARAFPGPESPLSLE